MSWIPRVDTEFAGYRLDSLLGHGGMSIVYRAQHLRLDRTVALKLLTPQLSEDESFRDRFVRESRSAAALDHPNIIPIYEADEEGGVFFIAMRYVDGSDLKTLLQREGPLDAQRTVSIIEQAASALEAAHAKGLIHRDVKPANILMASGVGQGTDHIYLSDFGIAKQTAAPGFTKTGMFVGTADYAAPEQIEGKPLDGRADIYALGCVLYECLTGTSAYDKDSEVALMYAHLLEPPPAVTAKRADLPSGVDEVVSKAMAKSVDERYSSGKELASDLRAALSRAATQTEGVIAGLTTPTAGETVLTDARPAEKPPSVAPPPPPGDGLPRRRPQGKLLIGVAAAALALVAGILAVLVLAGDDNQETPAATPPQPVGEQLPGKRPALANLVPGSLLRHCIATQQPQLPGAIESAVCLQPDGVNQFPDRWSISTYPSEASLKQAYEAELAKSGAKEDTGRCDGSSWGGEGPWAHGPGKPGGRRFCFFAGNDAVIVWTHEKLGQPDHLDVIATAREGGTDHATLFNWWRFWHHRIGKAQA